MDMTRMTKEKSEYKLTLSGDGLNLSRSVAEATAQQIVALVLGGSAAPNTFSQTSRAQPEIGGAHGSNPKAFMAVKRPATDMERVTCLAYFLTREKNISAFKTKELTELNRDAAQPKFSNVSATARNAVSDGYLAAAGGGQKQITARGEALVEALPDRERVKEALEKFPKARRRKPQTKKVKK